ncbi:MAG: NAD-dependent epimerase/dehydratase family protein, partial [Minisyncoccia bacterium]
MRALVTGAAGFIGTHLVESLERAGHDVLPLDKKIGTGRRVVVCDIEHRNALMSVFEQFEPDVVFHLAAEASVPKSFEQPLETHDVNVTGTLNVLEAAKSGSVRHMVFASSCAVYAEPRICQPIRESSPFGPVSLYGLHKEIGEQYCKMYADVYGLPTVVLRFFNVFGPGARSEGPYASVIAKFLERRSQGQPMEIHGDGTQQRDFVHVQDVVRALILAAAISDSNGSVFNVGTGIALSVNDIAKIVDGPIERGPKRSREPSYVCAHTEWSRNGLGWTAKISVAEGVAELK